MSDDRTFMSDVMTDAELTVAHQDALDGAALREFQESLERPSDIRILLRPKNRKTTYAFAVQGRDRLHYGHTLAEAFRKALDEVTG